MDAHELNESFQNANPATQSMTKAVIGLSLVLRNPQIELGIRVDVVKNILLAFSASMQFIAIENFQEGLGKFEDKVPPEFLMLMMKRNYAEQESNATDKLRLLLGEFPEFEGVDIDALAREANEEKEKEKEHGTKNGKTGD